MLVFNRVTALHSLFNLLEECLTSFFFTISSLASAPPPPPPPSVHEAKLGAGTQMGRRGGRRRAALRSSWTRHHLSCPGTNPSATLWILQGAKPLAEDLHFFFFFFFGQARPPAKCAFTSGVGLHIKPFFWRERRLLQGGAALVLRRFALFGGWISHQGDALVPLMKL